MRLPKTSNVKASPVGANGKLYLATEEGDVVVFRMGEKFEVIATNTLAVQVFIATPVIAGDNLFLRGQNTLFCIGQSQACVNAVLVSQKECSIVSETNRAQKNKCETELSAAPVGRSAK